MGKIKAYVPRSRNGCLTCKKRRVKCDESKPKCNNCSRLKMTCSYKNILLFEDDAKRRGITFGRSVKARELKKSIANGKSCQNNYGLSEEDLLNMKKITIKRDQYLFINNQIDDFTKKQLNIRSVNKDCKVSPKIPDWPILHKNDNLNIENDNNNNSFNNNDSNFNTLNDENFSNNAISHIFSVSDFDINNNYQHNELNNMNDIFLQSFSSPHLMDINNNFKPNDFSPSKSDIDTLSNTSSNLFYSTLTSLEKKLLKYFEESICPYCVCYPNTSSKRSFSNPYLNLIVPLALKSKIVMKVVISASAKQLVLLGNKEYEKVAKTYSYEVLKELPNIIDEKQKNQDKNWDDVLTTVLMLCFTEISVNCNDSWLIHLNGAKQFLKESCIRNNLSSVGKFFIRYFISHEVMGETAWVYDKKFQSIKPINDDPYIEKLKHDSDTTIDLVLGTSPYMITLIHRISVLGKCFEELEFERNANEKLELEAKILQQADHIENCLVTLNEKLPLINEEADKNVGKFIKMIAEMKRLAAIIYLFARIQLEYQYYNGSNSLTDNKSIKIKQYTKKIIELQKLLPSTYVSLLWPIFIVGIVSAIDEDDRWWVLNCLTEMQRHRELKSVKTAKDVVVSVWKEKDLEYFNSTRWKDMIKGKANAISLA